MIIRNMVLEDLKYKKEIEKLIEIAFGASFEDLQNIKEIAEKKRGELFEYMRVGKAEALISLDEEKIMGICWYFFREEAGEKICHLSQIAVTPPYQRKGISSQFLFFLEKKCKEKEVKKIELNVGFINKKAIDFYKKNNFFEERILMKKIIN